MDSKFAQLANRHHVLDEQGIIYDICFVLNVSARGWILEKICRIIERASGKLCVFMFSERNDRLSAPLPRARNYFFSHFSICYFTMQSYPEVWAANRYVWYTHPDFNKGITQDGLVEMIDNCTHVFTPCSHNRDTLLEWGARGDNISVPLGGADPAAFTPHKRTATGAVGFVGAYYERKQPEKMLQIARDMPDRTILLLGPRPQDVDNVGMLWRNWRAFEDFLALPNVRYIEAEYVDYPTLYGEMDVLCSTSSLEGGPINVVEALMSNVMPVVSDTGFARDLIEHGRNGFIFPVDAPSEAIVPLIRQALADVETDIATESVRYSWENFGREIWNVIKGGVQLNREVPLSTPEAGVRHLTSGFHRPEQRGAWTRSLDCEFRLSPAEGEAEPTEAVIFAWTAADGEDKVNVEAFIEGVPAGEFSVGGSPQRFTMLLPAQRDARSEFRVHLKADRFCPKMAETETRRLGIKIGWIMLR